MYPSCIKFKAADGALAKGAITFLSQDKEHFHQQIQQFEHKMFEIVCDKLHCSSNHWSRYSDGCEAKIKSGCCWRHAACSRKHGQLHWTPDI